MARAPARENWLIFVDTNIMLDFYRMPGESVERQIAGLERHEHALVITEQVQMEYLKHRQRVIVDSIKHIPRPSKISLPMIVSGSEPGIAFSAHLTAAIASHGNVQQAVEDILNDPEQHDLVYRALGRLFAADTPLNLRRPNPLRFEVRNSARKRFLLGYPPRKSNDLSIGDALNWEWIVHCAKERANHNVLIVSRDGDYGVTYGDKVILNDWLQTEFRARVGDARRIDLTNRLTTALKKLDEVVAVEDEKAEDAIIESPSSRFWKESFSLRGPTPGKAESIDQIIKSILQERAAGLSQDE